MKKNIFVFLPTCGQPRYNKRISQLMSLGYEIEVFYFERKFNKRNKFPDGVQSFRLGRINDREYFRRIPKLFFALLKILAEKKKRKPLFCYSMSIDSSFMATLCGIKKIITELGDLPYTSNKYSVVNFGEKLVLKKSKALVLTSPAFYESYYKDKYDIRKEKVFIIENKISMSLKGERPLNKSFSSEIIKIGLIGLLRYKKPINYLLNFIRENPKGITLECFGDGPYKNIVRNAECGNVKYHGSFRSPEDLATIYQNVDLNFVVYDGSLLNEQLALPNKLYESIFWGVPIVCCTETFLSNYVEKRKIGTSVQINNYLNFKNGMLEILNVNKIQEYSKNCFLISEESLIDDGETVLSNVVKETVIKNGKSKKNKFIRCL